MNIERVKEAVNTVKSMFVYQEDPKSKIDPWMVMPEEKGKMKGDCDDFAITTCFYALGFLGFIFRVIIKKEFKLVFCETSSGGGHMVTEYEGYAWDNWTKEVLLKGELYKRTGHIRKHEYSRCVIIMCLLSGLFLKLKRKCSRG